MSRRTEIIIEADLDEFKLLVFNGVVGESVTSGFHQPRIETGDDADLLLRDIVSNKFLGPFYQQIICNIMMGYYAKAFEDLMVKVTLFD